MELTDLLGGVAILTASYAGASALLGEMFYRFANSDYNTISPEAKRDINPPQRRAFYIDMSKRPLIKLYSLLKKSAWVDYEKRTPGFRYSQLAKSSKS